MGMTNTNADVDTRLEMLQSTNSSFDMTKQVFSDSKEPRVSSRHVPDRSERIKHTKKIRASSRGVIENGKLVKKLHASTTIPVE